MSVRVPTTGPVAQAQRHRLDEVLRVGALVRRAAAPRLRRSNRPRGLAVSW